MEQIKQYMPRQATTFWDDFKAFAIQGNMIDLAVGIVIGTAFNAVVNSLVNDIIMQIIAGIFGKPDFSSIVIGPVHIGAFITNVINFLIIALSVFVVMKVVMRLKKKEVA